MNGKGDGIGNGELSALEREYIRRYHRHEPGENQCSSELVKRIKAPVHLVWSLVRRFDQPQKYKPFVSRCVLKGNLEIGSLREVDVKSGLPATTSTERLELLDDDEHVLSMKIIGGDHRLRHCGSSCCGNLSNMQFAHIFYTAILLCLFVLIPIKESFLAKKNRVPDLIWAHLLQTLY